MPTPPTGPHKSFGFKTEREVLDYVSNPANGIEFIRVIFPDILGRQMYFSFPSSELEKACSEGTGFDGSSLQGFVRIEESDLVIKPEARSLRVLPWEYKGFAEDMRWREAVMFGDILTPEGEVFPGDSRAVLKRTLARAKKEFGFDDFNVGPELQVFLFSSERETHFSDEGGDFFRGRQGEIRNEGQQLLNT